jgi:hypothetical protein
MIKQAFLGFLNFLHGLQAEKPLILIATSTTNAEEQTSTMDGESFSRAN